MSLKIRPLSKSLQAKAKTELNEIPSQIEANLQHLKDWVTKQEYLKARNDDQLLINFLRGSKYSLQRTKEKLDAYYTYRTIAPEMSKNMDPFSPNVQAYLKSGFCVPLSTPTSDPSSPRILLLRFGDYNADEITVFTIQQAATIIIDILMNEDDNFAVAGVITLSDMKGMKIKTVGQITPSILYKLAYYYEKAYPARIKAAHFINIPKYAEPLLNMFKLIASKKLIERLYFHFSGDWESIYREIPKSVLPAEYGGEAGLFVDMAAKWKSTVESFRSRLIDESNYYSDESKRPGSQNILETLFGIDGSFRKLELD